MDTNPQQAARLEDVLPELRGEDYAVVLACDDAIKKADSEHDLTTGRYLKVIREKLTSKENAGSGMWTRYCAARGIPMSTAEYRIAQAEGQPYSRRPLFIHEPLPRMSPLDEQTASFNVGRDRLSDRPAGGEDATPHEQPARVIYQIRQDEPAPGATRLDTSPVDFGNPQEWQTEPRTSAQMTDAWVRATTFLLTAVDALDRTVDDAVTVAVPEDLDHDLTTVENAVATLTGIESKLRDALAGRRVVNAVDAAGT